MFLAAVGEYPVECGEQAGNRAFALRVQHAKIDNLCVGGDANVCVLRDIPIAGGDFGHVSPVSIRIVRAVLAREIQIYGDA